LGFFLTVGLHHCCLFYRLKEQNNASLHSAPRSTILDPMNMIESRSDVMMGKPVVAGTRITVECILERLAAGETIEGIVEEHPRLNREAVLAAIEFAAEALRADVVYPVPIQAT
jgi:uncharacterized protein (DUF433 family)